MTFKPGDLVTYFRKGNRAGDRALTKLPAVVESISKERVTVRLEDGTKSRVYPDSLERRKT